MNQGARRRSKNKRRSLKEAASTRRQELSGAPVFQQGTVIVPLQTARWPSTDGVFRAQRGAARFARALDQNNCIHEVLPLLWATCGTYAEDAPGSEDMVFARRSRKRHEAALVSGESHGDCAFPTASSYYPFASRTGTADGTKATTARKQQGELSI